MVFFFQAEDGIRDLVRSRGLGDVYKRQLYLWLKYFTDKYMIKRRTIESVPNIAMLVEDQKLCLLYTSDAADERSSVDLGGRRIIKKKTTSKRREC